MKIYKNRVVPEHIIQVVDKRTCDLCGFVADATWNSGIYEIEETEIHVKVHQRSGETYPEDSFGTIYDIDICPVCFENKLVPWLRSQGANIKEEVF